MSRRIDSFRYRYYTLGKKRFLRFTSDFGEIHCNREKRNKSKILAWELSTK